MMNDDWTGRIYDAHCSIVGECRSINVVAALPGLTTDGRSALRRRLRVRRAFSLLAQLSQSILERPSCIISSIPHL